VPGPVRVMNARSAAGVARLVIPQQPTRERTSISVETGHCGFSHRNKGRSYSITYSASDGSSTRMMRRILRPAV
jgi:hypothetical protein